MSAVRKGALVRTDTPDRVDFTFNPQTLKVRKTASWSSTPRPGRRYAPPPQFVGTNPRTIELQVLFDAWTGEGPTVQERVNLLLSWTCPTQRSFDSEHPQPPLVRLDWGGLTEDLECFVKDVTATCLLFDEQGAPTRATADLVLEETPDEVRRQNPTSGGEPGTRQRTSVGGDSLQSLAHEEYGDAGLWRALAEANGIDDPMRVPAGQRLLVPPRTTARAVSAEPGRA